MKIFDALHGFIRLHPEEECILDSSAFQRLRFVHQVGPTYLLYPGATHTRFEHSLGVMELATRIFHTLFSLENLQEVKARSKQEKQGVQESLHALAQLSDEERKQALTLLRLAALCHDMGHLPFSHTAEESLLGEKGHEKMTKNILQSSAMDAVWSALAAHMGSDIREAVTAIALGEARDPLHSILSEIITNDFFGADRMDYLLRDAACTGVRHGLFDSEQLIDSLRLLPYQGKIKIGILKSGQQAIESLQVARYFMYSRVYRHPVGAAYAYHFRQFMYRYRHSAYLEKVENYLNWADPEVLVDIRQAAAKGDEHAQAITQRKSRYRALWLEPKDWTSSSWQELTQFVLDMQKEDARVAFTFDGHSIVGRENCQKAKVLLTLQWGKVQPFEQAGLLKVPDVSSCYLFVPTDIQEKLLQMLQVHFQISPKLY